MNYGSFASVYRLPWSVFGLCVLLGCEWHDVLVTWYGTPPMAMAYYRSTRFTSYPFNALFLIAFLWTFIFVLRKVVRSGNRFDLMTLIFTFLIVIPYASIIVPSQEQLIRLKLPDERKDAMALLKVLSLSHAALLPVLLLLVVWQINSHHLSVPSVAVEDAERAAEHERASLSKALAEDIDDEKAPSAGASSDGSTMRRRGRRATIEDENKGEPRSKSKKRTREGDELATTTSTPATASVSASSSVKPPHAAPSEAKDEPKEAGGSASGQAAAAAAAASPAEVGSAPDVDAADLRRRGRSKGRSKSKGKGQEGSASGDSVEASS